MDYYSWKFRGKRIDTGEWVTGSYVKVYYICEISHFIYPGCVDTFGKPYGYEIMLDTLGLYSGYKVKNKQEICQGDVLSGIFINDDPYPDGEVTFEYGCFGIKTKAGKYTYIPSLDEVDIEQLEIIKTIHDHIKVDNKS